MGRWGPADEVAAVSAARRGGCVVVAGRLVRAGMLLLAHGGHSAIRPGRPRRIRCPNVSGYCSQRAEDVRTAVYPPDLEVRVPSGARFASVHLIAMASWKRHAAGQMAQHSQSSPSRNAPCPCGSGKKTKRCCGGVSTADSDHAPASVRKTGAGPWLLGFGLAAFVVISIFAMSSMDRSPSETPETSSRSAPFRSSSPGGSTPEPWEFDAANNRHWHPGHGHWHQGPPPAFGRDSGAASSESMSGVPEGSTPEPWYYDADADRHWDPSHGHWHSGPPPPSSMRP